MSSQDGCLFTNWVQGGAKERRHFFQNQLFMKILWFLVFCFWSLALSAQSVPDTLSGVALVLTEGGRVTVDPNTGYAHISRGLVLLPEWALCIQNAVDAPSASGVNEISVGWTNRYVRADGTEIPPERIFWFKVMRRFND